VLITISVDNDFTFAGVIVYLMSENDADIIKVIPKHGVDASDFINRIFGIDPIDSFRVPAQVNSFYRHIDQMAVLSSFGFVLPAEARYQSSQPPFLFTLEDLLPHIDKAVVQLEFKRIGFKSLTLC